MLALGTFLVLVLAPLHLFAQLTETSSDSLSVTILGSTECIDGIDNDSDGFTDFPDDPDCVDFADDAELVYSPPGGGGGGGGGGGDPDSTTVLFRGLTFPLAELTVTKNGQVMETDTADTDGDFDLRLSDLSEGQYNFVIHATDPEELRSVTPAFTVTVKEDVTTSISGVYIPPTIRLDKAQVKKGNTLTADGYAMPNSTVHIFMNSSADPVDSVVSSTNGAWVYLFDTNTVGYGDQTIRAKVVEDTYESSFSYTLSFKIGLTDVFEEVTNACGSVADLNGDCRVNLIDFSIAAFWYKKANPPVHVDINSDGKVDIRDFSIMAFHWTG
jgi:hypothetical protein